MAAGPDDGNGPSVAWQLKAVEEQERIRLNLLNLRRRGEWDFVNELQPLAPRKLATMVHENDVGGLLDYFMPAPGPRKDPDSVNSLEQFQEIFTVIKPPDVVGWSPRRCASWAPTCAPSNRTRKPATSRPGWTWSS